MDCNTGRISGAAGAIAFISLLVFIAVAPAVTATTPMAASGVMNRVSSERLGLRVTDEGDTIINLRNTWNFQGTFVGSLVADVTVVIHVDGPVTVTEWGTFTGTVAGASGTVTFRDTGSGEGGIFELQWVVLDGTGDLAALRGHGTSQVNGPLGTGNYSGQIHFE